jgi:uncharacterized protein with FMN-binding domain
MKRVIATVLGTVISLVLLLSYKTHSLSSSNAAASPPALTTPSSGSDPSAAASVPPSAGPSVQPSGSASAGPTTAAPTTTKKPSSAAKKVVQGNAVDTRYGPVQVQVTLSGSTITDVAILQVPQREQRDVEINGYAVPILRQEALQAQNAKIDMVSGATYTSVAYLQSLQSALDKAGKSG